MSTESAAWTVAICYVSALVLVGFMAIESTLNGIKTRKAMIEQSERHQKSLEEIAKAFASLESDFEADGLRLSKTEDGKFRIEFTAKVKGRDDILACKTIIMDRELLYRFAPFSKIPKEEK